MPERNLLKNAAIGCSIPLAIGGGIYLANRLKNGIDGVRKNPRLNFAVYPTNNGSPKNESLDSILHEAIVNFLTENLHTETIDDEDHHFEPPSKRYRGRWGWDEVHAAVGAAHHIPEIAKQLFITEAKVLDKFHFHMPQILYLNHSGGRLERALFNYLRCKDGVDQLTQTPLIGLGLEIYAKLTGDFDTVKKVLPVYAKHYQHIKDTRYVYKGIDLPVCIHAFESLDAHPHVSLMYNRNIKSKPMFTVLTQGTLRKARELDFDPKRITYAQEYSLFDITYCSFFTRSLYSLAYLFEQIGDSEQAQYWQEEAEKSHLSLISTCFDEENGFFYSRRANRKGELLKVDTAAGLFPMMCNFAKLNPMFSDIPSLLIKRLETRSRFVENGYCIPTVFQDEKDFYTENMNLLMQGPSFSVLHYYFGLGLWENNLPEYAQKIWEGEQARVANWLESGGRIFPEFYLPFDKIFNDPYTWTILSSCNPAKAYHKSRT